MGGSWQGSPTSTAAWHCASRGIKAAGSVAWLASSRAHKRNRQAPRRGSPAPTHVAATTWASPRISSTGNSRRFKPQILARQRSQGQDLCYNTDGWHCLIALPMVAAPLSNTDFSVLGCRASHQHTEGDNPPGRGPWPHTDGCIFLGHQNRQQSRNQALKLTNTKRQAQALEREPSEARQGGFSTRVLPTPCFASRLQCLKGLTDHKVAAHSAECLCRGDNPS